MDLSKITLIGNVVRAPRTGKLPSGDVVVNFSVATNYASRDAQTKKLKQSVPDYHDVVAWGRLAEVVEQYVQKGTKVYVEGRLRSREYTARDGTKVRTYEVMLGDLRLLSSKPTQPVEDKLAPEDIETPAQAEA